MDPEAIRDLFQDFGSVRLRRMFVGQGIYCDDLIFGLEAGGEIYLKADAESAARFEAAGSRPFTYEKGGKTYPMSYWLLPGEAADDPEAAAAWGRLALAAARRAAASKARTKRKGR